MRGRRRLSAAQPGIGSVSRLVGGDKRARDIETSRSSRGTRATRTVGGSAAALEFLASRLDYMLNTYGRRICSSRSHCVLEASLETDGR